MLCRSKNHGRETQVTNITRTTGGKKWTRPNVTETYKEVTGPGYPGDYFKEILARVMVPDR